MLRLTVRVNSHHKFWKPHAHSEKYWFWTLPASRSVVTVQSQTQKYSKCIPLVSLLCNPRLTKCSCWTRNGFILSHSGL